MDKQSRTYQAYVQILKEELIPAMGCTEPIAIAYAAAKARDVLGGMPDKVEIGVSSNIIKNVKSVIVPNTDGMKGIEAAAAAGIVGGQTDKALEVIEYARELGASDETLCRALALSNLIAIHEKAGIGRLSAYCGAVSAGCAAGCGIAYLQGADLKAVSHTLVNARSIVSGIICDGAKASCAAKIASSVEAGILGYHMYKNGQQFRSGDGIVTKGVENTIRNVGLLGREGMRETDKEIVRIMLQEP